LKISFLGVKPATLERHGAVSRETALEMSGGIRERTKAVSASASRSRRPEAASPEACRNRLIGIADNHSHEARLFQFHGDASELSRHFPGNLNRLRTTLLQR
jgi:nicotinamide-nucleotide amidase